MTEPDISTTEKLRSLQAVAHHRPVFMGFVLVLSLLGTLLEGIGLTFLFPIIEAAQAGGDAAQNAGGVTGLFLEAYLALGLPFTLEFLIGGLAAVMVVRYSVTFLSSWLASMLTVEYERYLRTHAYELALGATVSYYDDEGSDDILNAIITQTQYASGAIQQILSLVQQTLLCLMYAAIALFIAPALTVLATVVFGGLTYLIRHVIEPGYTVGDRVASANERVQENVQAGTQGIRDIKLFGMTEHLLEEFHEIVDRYTTSRIALYRNQIAIGSFYELSVAIVLFGLIYVAITYLALSISALGVFLFAMFRLGPRISGLNSAIYAIEGNLPHLVRTHRFVDRLADNQEPDDGTRPAPDRIDTVEFDDVSFAYDDGEIVLDDISLRIDRGEFVGIVGPSGAGKSTIVSLLARTYDPTDGEIRANGTPVEEFDLREWRDNVAMVRQDPHIFNDTLRYNLTTGRDVPDRDLERVSEVAQIAHFLDDLPASYDTVLGDNGVKLSGGQRQRVALARALLSDAELLILDEATSDLDSDLERRIHETIERLGDDRTVVAIAHRLSTVRGADRIYTVEHGRITESGTHHDLIQNDGKYAHLHSIQDGSIEHA
ncbi:ABC transporter ATP-binding protein [Natronomonas salsuginis]|uniref:ABC transporter ATP-binding protein n=1 Tax=Natronomonas salsuginis TaxID=2217661 RepID=A0A4U5J995_9EURY|nr:ABC transporter ATP-binding protein [Natronomonas salsuginis]TKR25690.1 ABC transporter ATP-binding protein [Natronomonas salsuginis]